MSVGRKPQPTALKLIKGNPGHRPINQTEPQPSGIPTCPDHLNEVAKAEWEHISQELLSIGLLTSVDRAALAAYCQCYARWLEAENNIAKFGLVVKSPKSGYPIPNPYVSIANTALALMHKFLIEFGLTPASRTRLQVNPMPISSDDPWDNLNEIDGPAADQIT